MVKGNEVEGKVTHLYEVGGWTKRLSNPGRRWSQFFFGRLIRFLPTVNFFSPSLTLA